MNRWLRVRRPIALLAVLLVGCSAPGEASPSESGVVSPSAAASAAVPSPSGPPTVALEDRMAAALEVEGADFPIAAFDSVWVVSQDQPEPAIVRSTRRRTRSSLPSMSKGARARAWSPGSDRSGPAPPLGSCGSIRQRTGDLAAGRAGGDPGAARGEQGQHLGVRQLHWSGTGRQPAADRPADRAGRDHSAGPCGRPHGVRVWGAVGHGPRRRPAAASGPHQRRRDDRRGRTWRRPPSSRLAWAASGSRSTATGTRRLTTARRPSCASTRPRSRSRASSPPDR